MATRSKRFSVLIVFLFAVVTLLSALYFMPITSSKSQNQNGDEQKKMTEAIRRGGYREAAKIKGHYVSTVDPYWDWASFDLETLTKSSAAVVIGIPEGSKGRLDAEGQMIVTEFDVRVKETIKGTPLAENSVVKVALLGGRVDFEDGTSAELRTRDSEPMLEGKKYLLFLYANRNGSDVYLLTGGPQGLFELRGQAGIKAHARSSDPAVKEVQNLNEDGLREKVKDYARKWPESQQCCK